MRTITDNPKKSSTNSGISFVYNDGGRAAAGYKGETRDCVVRAIAIVTNQSYQLVYDQLNKFTKEHAKTKRDKIARQLQNKAAVSVRNGVFKPVFRKYLLSLGATWVPTMHVGQGCKIHLQADELPKGRLIVSVSKHLCAVIDGVLNDTFDCSRSGTRCVYGYYQFKN